jgi:hypothetical protein
MKIYHIIGMAVVLMLSIHFVTVGSAGSHQQEFTQNIIIEKTVPSGAKPASRNPSHIIDEDKTIFSKTTIISLIVAVIGIVAFRMNSNS